MIATDTENQLPTLGRLARRTVATILGALQNRAELFTVEFEEENDRLLKMVVCAFSAVFLTMIALLLITGTVIFLVPEAYRVYAAGGFAVLYLAGAAFAGLTMKKLIKTPPFAESLNQFKKDAELLDAFK
jgi:uncharacterized membrane protein YqjE